MPNAQRPVAGLKPSRAVGFELDKELKFTIPASRTSLAVEMLQQGCVPDPEFPEGIVSSVYYDTRDWKYLLEKRNSDYLKTKVRVRWYRHPDASQTQPNTAFVEAKYRVGSKRRKVRLPTDLAGDELAAMDLERGELRRLPQLLVAGGFSIAPGLVPSILVTYRRRRFVERAMRLRISIDYGISAPNVNRHMLSHVYPCVLPHSVLEVKGSEDRLPAALQPLFKLGLRKASFSKYLECYRQLTGTTF